MRQYSIQYAISVKVPESIRPFIQLILYHFFNHFLTHTIHLNSQAHPNIEQSKNIITDLRVQ